MPGEAVASTPGTELGGLVVGNGSVVVPWQARVMGTWSLACSEGTRVKACGLLVKPKKPMVAGLVVWASKPSERVKAAWAKSRRYGVRSARALAGGQDTSRHRGFGGFPQNRHPNLGFTVPAKNRATVSGKTSKPWSTEVRAMETERHQETLIGAIKFIRRSMFIWSSLMYLSGFAPTGFLVCI